VTSFPENRFDTKVGSNRILASQDLEQINGFPAALEVFAPDDHFDGSFL
jgi:hypothetical protein